MQRGCFRLFPTLRLVCAGRIGLTSTSLLRIPIMSEKLVQSHRLFSNTYWTVAPSAPCSSSTRNKCNQSLFIVSKHSQEQSMAAALHTTASCNIEEENHTKALTVWTNLHSLRSSPLPALTLGLSGLIPFITVPAYFFSAGVYIPEVAFLQHAYGACILSFLGGVRWGFVIPEENPIQPNWVNLGYSVTPSLIAWCGLLMPEPFGALTILTGLGFAAYADMAMYGYPAWFKGLRFLLSFVAILSMWSTFMCYFVMTEEVKPVLSHEQQQQPLDVRE